MARTTNNRIEKKLISGGADTPRKDIKQFIKWEKFPPSYQKDDCLPWENPKEIGIDGYQFEEDIIQDFHKEKNKDGKNYTRSNR